jgi:hypothetical protein
MIHTIVATTALIEEYMPHPLGIKRNAIPSMQPMFVSQITLRYNFSIPLCKDHEVAYNSASWTE